MERLELDAGKLARPVLRGRGGSNAALLPDQALETKARFIGQVITGESAIRRAEDIGGQELSYAEVKAIASGNPAVLVLAEAEAELQRLAVLKRNHADEQYLARRKLKELPEQIARLEERRETLTADQKTVLSGDPNVLVIGHRSVSLRDTPAALTRILEGIPETADRKFPLGTYRGLSFGIVYHWGHADVYLAGRTELRAPLAKESRGPRAVLNALNRLTASYDERLDASAKERELARNQLHDYEARLGRTFVHSSYLSELADLRDRLKMALSETPTEGEPSPAELAEQIKTLKNAHAIEAAPSRIREKPPIEATRRRVEPAQPVPQQEPPSPEVSDPPVCEESPADDEEDASPGSFRGRVRRSVQGRLFD